MTALDRIHRFIGGVLITATASGLAAIGYGVFSLYILRPAAAASTIPAVAAVDAAAGASHSLEGMVAGAPATGVTTSAGTQLQ